MSDQPSRVDEAGLDVLSLEPRIALENGVRAVPGSEHAEDVLHIEPPWPGTFLPPA